MTQEKIEEEISEFMQDFFVTYEPQQYQAYPCHITEFQEECITEKLKELLSSRDTYWKERETKAYEDGFRCGHTEGHKDGVSYRSSQMRDFISKQTQDGGLDESWYGAFFAMKRHLEALTPTPITNEDNPTH